MSSGDTTISLYTSIYLTKLAIFGGENLWATLTEIDYYCEIMKKLKNKNLLPYLLQYRETISILVDKGHHTGSHSNADGSCEGINSCVEGDQRFVEGNFMNRALQAFWCGHAQRCHHYSLKMIELQSVGQFNKPIVSFVSL